MKKRVAVIYGGPSTEHEVSHVSSSAVIKNLDREKYEVFPLYWSKENNWLEKSPDPDYKPKKSGKMTDSYKALSGLANILEKNKIEIIFPVLHGPYGEDGSIQGLFETMRIPYVGCGVTGSAVCMDKVIQKNVCRDYGIPVVPFFWLSRYHWKNKKEQTLDLINKNLGDAYPLFVKPVNQGSSVGVTKAHNEKELIKGIEIALTRDTKVIVEQGVKNVREVECSVLGYNAKPETSVLGEVLPEHEFYDFESKYLSDKSKTIIPAKLDQELTDKIGHTAKLAFEIMDCSGLSRIDFLINDKTGKFYLNELNTMPGFTPISMYPKLWEKSGIKYGELLDKLIEVALNRYKEKNSLNLSR